MSLPEEKFNWPEGVKRAISHLLRFKDEDQSQVAAEMYYVGYVQGRDRLVEAMEVTEFLLIIKTYRGTGMLPTVLEKLEGFFPEFQQK